MTNQDMQLTAEEMNEIVQEILQEGVQSYRDNFRQHAGRETTLSDQQIAEVVASADDDQDDWSPMMIAAEEKISDAAGPVSEEVKANLSSVHRLRSEAFKAAEKASQDQELIHELETETKNREESSRRSIHVLKRLQAMYSAEEIESWPIPGSVQPDEAKPGDNQRYDKWWYDDMKNGEPVKVKGSFYSDFYSRFPMAQDAARHVEMLSAAIKQDARHAGHYAGMSKVLATKKKHLFNQRLNTGKNKITEAVLTYHNMKAINAIEGLTCGFMQTVSHDAEGNETLVIDETLLAPVYITLKSNIPGQPDDTNYFTLRTFSRMQPEWAKDPEKVKEYVNKLGALMASSAKGANETEEEKAERTKREKAAAVVPEIVNIRQAWDAIANLHNYMENTAAKATLIKELRKQENDGLVRALFDFQIEVTDITTNYPDLRRRYDQICLKESAALEKAAELARKQKQQQAASAA